LNRVLVIAPMDINHERRGPANRSWELARVLSQEQQVTLLVANEDHPVHPDFEVKVCAPREAGAKVFADLLADQDIVLIQGSAFQRYPRLAEILASGDQYLVVDLYDPITLEQLAIDTGGPVGRWLHLEYTALLNEQLKVGDFFLCANERQRAYWLGALTALGRLNHDTWDGEDFRRLIEIVPFGLPAEPPRAAAGLVLKGVVPGIGPTDQIILWGGGLWDWLDPLTPVRAMARVAARKPQARLVFFRLAEGWTAMSLRTSELAAELGLLDRQVVFAPWLPPEQWAACLLEADVGLSFHEASIETHFAFRTRLLDYIWAGLPIVAASGDVLGQMVAAHGLGHVVEPGDVEGLAEALISLLDEADARRKRRDAFRHVAAQLTWEEVTRPLVDYCREPWHAGDAGPSFTRRWLAAEQDRVLSEAAHAARWRLEAEAYARAIEKELEKTREQLRHSEEQLRQSEEQLRQSEEQLQAAMNGRVMRLLTAAQRTWRRLRGRRP
jgi:glycosyltransferase involved in cell wall biosynthesis